MLLNLVLDMMPIDHAVLKRFMLNDFVLGNLSGPVLYCKNVSAPTCTVYKYSLPEGKKYAKGDSAETALVIFTLGNVYACTTVAPALH